jgi:hypothetical protein
VSTLRGHSEINAMNLHGVPVRSFLLLINAHSLLQIADTSVLNSIDRAKGAGYEHRNRRGCFEGTRVVLLDETEQRTDGSDGSRIFWLNGLVGTGKSMIAHTVAERCFAKGKLGASFCSSNPSLKDHDDRNSVFPTLAFQLAQKYPKF